MAPFAFGYQLRQVVYQRAGGGCGENTIIHHGTTIEDRRTRFGKDVWVSTKVYIDYAVIEDHVLIGPEAVILSGRNQHNSDRLDIPIKSQGNPSKAPIYVREGAWIGANATVMADVGRHAIVGAGSVVVEPVPDYAVVVGNPARIIKDRRQTSNQFLAKEA
jgi:virginiamycin A acetyltransferase